MIIQFGFDKIAIQSPWFFPVIGSIILLAMIAIGVTEIVKAIQKRGRLKKIKSMSDNDPRKRILTWMENYD